MPKPVLDQADATQKMVDDAYNQLLKAIVQLEKAGSGSQPGGRKLCHHLPGQ